MAVDKNLFKYDLAVVAILCNEGHYLKEWLDYHLLAGVDHFYLYNHESTDNYDEIVQPYVEKGLVTSVYFPGELAMYPAYMDAVEKYKFDCRYMAFIDGDEFIFPKTGQSIVEYLDGFFSDKPPEVAGLAINWNLFGSNGHIKADYTRGVMERFTRCQINNVKTSSLYVKTIANPRKIAFFINPHFPIYFENNFSISEDGNKVESEISDIATTKTIDIHHYHIKSWEEHQAKNARVSTVCGDSERVRYNRRHFEVCDFNEVYDDSILKYRDARIDALNSVGGGGDNLLEKFASIKKVNYGRIVDALQKNLSPTFLKNVPPEFYDGKMENFVTCFRISTQFKNNILDETAGKFFEELSLNAIYKSLSTDVRLADLRLFFRELPKILTLDYPVVENIRKLCIEVAEKKKDVCCHYLRMKDYIEWDYTKKMLETFGTYIKK